MQRKGVQKVCIKLDRKFRKPISENSKTGHVQN